MRSQLSHRPAREHGGRAPRAGQAVHVLDRSARVLLAELPVLTDRLVATLREEQPAYAVAADAHPRRLWQEVNESMRYSIGALTYSREARASARAYTRALGAARAREDFPMDAVLHAFRLGGVLVWERLLEIAGRRSPDDVRPLIHSAADVWNFVDQQCVIIADAYRQQERESARSTSCRVDGVLRDLLHGTTTLAGLSRAAAVLGLPEHDRYAVVAADGADRGAVRPPQDPPGIRLLWHSGERDLAVAHLGGEPVEALVAALRGGRGGVPAGVRVGVSPAVSGLAAVGEARRLAGTAVRTCPGGGRVVLLDEHLPAALLLSAPDLGNALVGRVLGPLLGLEPADRDLMLETLTVWLESEGSAQRAASRLYCHRNTVLNRLRRFEQLTGRALSRPDDLVELSLALTAHRLLPADA